MPLLYPAAAQVLSLTKPLGLYLHVPFCISKCNYCDFYSVACDCKGDYAKALIREIKKWGGNLSRPINTIYLGGGTPSLMAEYLPEILDAVNNGFSVTRDAEITMEMNPADDSQSILQYAKKAGINRLSIGAQSGNDNELKVLGRRHTAEHTADTVKIARALGFNNISLDLMIGLPNSTNNTLTENLKFVTDLAPEHISAYILKIEPDTPFWNMKESLNIPNDDCVADQYLLMCRYLKEKGYNHYEISNFSKCGFESRHNLKYWELEDYLGVGPAAHSCLDGKRFYYPRNLQEFINSNSPLPDGASGSEEERIMLGLRLSKGIELNANPKLKSKCRLLEKNGFLTIKGNRIALTDKGMLLSNSIITEIMECEL